MFRVCLRARASVLKRSPSASLRVVQVEQGLQGVSIFKRVLARNAGLQEVIWNVRCVCVSVCVCNEGVESEL